MNPAGRYHGHDGERQSDPVAVGLRALAWIVGDPDRAARMLALTGLDADGLRARASEPALLAAAIGFLEARESDLVACADALGLAPENLVRSRGAMER